MKRLWLLLASFIIATLASAEVIVLSGVYQGKDIYVKNPVTSSGVGFCVFEVLVNGQITSDEVNSPSFAIDLGSYGLKIGSTVEITLRLKEDCQVKILNPEAIYPTSTFEVIDINLLASGELTWRTNQESAGIPYAIEQYRWNKWAKVGEVKGIGGAGEHAYTFKVYLHSGENKFRLSQLDYRGSRYSQEVTVVSDKPPVSLVSTKFNKTIELTGETEYEMFSAFGLMFKSGRGATIDTSRLSKGTYYLNFDNQTGVTITKK
jgi:hypothetical protein